MSDIIETAFENDTDGPAAAVAEPVIRPQSERRKKRKKAEKQQTRHAPRWVVIVHNDEDHTFDYVIEMLQKVCGHELQMALQLTMQIHHTGRSVVWIGSREVAELKQEQIRNFGPDFYATNTVRYPIGCTIEPLDDGE